MESQIGKRLAGKYELGDLAGEGGMARVYQGITHGAAGFRRPVAVKRLLEPLSDNPEFVAMFVEEARVVSELQHPNIVQIHDFDQDDRGAYFLVMEWIDGLNLLDWCHAYSLRKEKTPWHLMMAVGIEVLKALGAAHDRKDARGAEAPIYHRDVTPQNILMSVTGNVKLSDFGLARAMDRARMTQPQMVKGKLSYLAPELTRGEDPTVQSDLFGVGIVMWEGLVGEKLFRGDTPLEILQSIQAANVPSLSEKREDVPAELHTIVHKALSADPADRYRSTSGMVRDLANVLRVTPESTSAAVIGSSVREAVAALKGNEPASSSEETEVLDFGELRPVATEPPAPPSESKKA